MSKLDYFNIEIRPYIYAGTHGGEEKTYRITVQADGEKFSLEKPGQVPPYMTEIEFLTRLSLHIRDEVATTQDNNEA